MATTLSGTEAALFGMSFGLRGLTFEPSCPPVQVLSTRTETIVRLAQAGLPVPAIAGQLERGVGPRRAQSLATLDFVPTFARKMRT